MNNNLTINIPANLTLTQDQFEQIAIANRDLRLELDPKGQLIIMPPTGGNTGKAGRFQSRG
jgi:Uma2 family endonuclease